MGKFQFLTELSAHFTIALCIIVSCFYCVQAFQLLVNMQFALTIVPFLNKQENIVVILLFLYTFLPKVRTGLSGSLGYLSSDRGHMGLNPSGSSNIRSWDWL